MKVIPSSNQNGIFNNTYSSSSSNTHRFTNFCHVIINTMGLVTNTYIIQIMSVAGYFLTCRKYCTIPCFSYGRYTVLYGITVSFIWIIWIWDILYTESDPEHCRNFINCPLYDIWLILNILSKPIQRWFHSADKQPNHETNQLKGSV